jgi:hypothetical protein
MSRKGDKLEIFIADCKDMNKSNRNVMTLINSF